GHGGGRQRVRAADRELRGGRIGHGLVERGRERQRRPLLDRTGRGVREGGGRRRVIDGEAGAAGGRGAHHVAGEVGADAHRHRRRAAASCGVLHRVEIRVVRAVHLRHRGGGQGGPL